MKIVGVFAIDTNFNGYLCVDVYFIKQETEEQSLDDYYENLNLSHALTTYI